MRQASNTILIIKKTNKISAININCRIKKREADLLKAGKQKSDCDINHNRFYIFENFDYFFLRSP